jgi:hypothetical protein
MRALPQNKRSDPARNFLRNPRRINFDMALFRRRVLLFDSFDFLGCFSKLCESPSLRWFYCILAQKNQNTIKRIKRFLESPIGRSSMRSEHRGLLLITSTEAIASRSSQVREEEGRATEGTRRFRMLTPPG